MKTYYVSGFVPATRHLKANQRQSVNSRNSRGNGRDRQVMHMTVQHYKYYYCDDVCQVLWSPRQETSKANILSQSNLL